MIKWKQSFYYSLVHILPTPYSKSVLGPQLIFFQVGIELSLQSSALFVDNGPPLRRKTAETETLLWQHGALESV